MRSDRQNTLIFDWNSTLLDDMQAMLDACNIIFARFGRDQVDLETYRSRYELPIEKFYQNHGFSAEEIPDLLPLFSEVFHTSYEPRATSLPLRDGARHVLEYAQHASAKTIILSNHLTPRIQEHLDRLEIGKFVADILAFWGRGEQFRTESKGDMLRRYMSAQSLHPECSVIVGDTIEEIEIAREQGLVSVAITGGCVSEARLRAAKPDYLIHSLTELKPILAERWQA